MKKTLSSLAAILLTACALGTAAFAAEGESATVYVTISDGNGSLVLTEESVRVTDCDGDGALTIHDALYAAHEEGYEGGAEAGYASSVGQYGRSLDKLWGTANGGSYGYCINHASAMSLTDPIKEGDYLNAYVYTDLVTWSDTYCYFDVNTCSAKAGEQITLTLTAAGYDASWNPVSLPVEGATITLNGTVTSYKTDAEGKVSFTVDESGEYIISATSDTQTLVPPICKLTVSDAPAQPSLPETGDAGTIGYTAIAVTALSAVCALVANRRKAYEK